MPMVKLSRPTVDGRNPIRTAQETLEWSDSPVNTKKQMVSHVSKWCRILSIHSSKKIHLRLVRNRNVCEWNCVCVDDGLPVKLVSHISQTHAGVLVSDAACAARFGNLSIDCLVHTPLSPNFVRPTVCFAPPVKKHISLPREVITLFFTIRFLASRQGFLL